MKSSYHIDPLKFPLEKFIEDLTSRKLIPSRLPLKVGLEEKFKIFRSLGWNNLHDLRSGLKDKKQIESLSNNTGIDVDYLTLLRREVNSYFPNPVPLGKFSGFSAEHISQLTTLGIRNSKHLYEKAVSTEDFESLGQETGIPEDTLRELAGLSDLVRGYGVGPAFARILYDTGIHSIRNLYEYSADQVVRLYEEKTGKKADFTESDIQFSLDIIKVLEN